LFFFKDLPLGKIEIKRVTEKDIFPLEKFLSSGDFGKHRDRLDKQRSGYGAYLIAWHYIPVGHIYIIWDGSKDGPLKERKEKEPVIEDFYIHPAARGKGIGKILLENTEKLIKENGYSRVGTSVLVSNPPIEKMYKKNGYKSAGYDLFESKRVFTNKSGKKKKWSRKVKYLVKQL